MTRYSKLQEPYSQRGGEFLSEFGSFSQCMGTDRFSRELYYFLTQQYHIFTTGPNVATHSTAKRYINNIIKIGPSVVRSFIVREHKSKCNTM